MKLYKRKNGVSWSMRFTFDGERIDRTTGFADKKRAEAFAEAFRTKLRNEGVGLLTQEKKDVPTFNKSLAYFHKSNAKRLEPSTCARYKVATDNLAKKFGNKRLDKITVADVEDYMNKRLDEKVLTPEGKSRFDNKTISASTVNKEMSVLKKLFNVYINRGLITKNPVCSVKFFEEDNQPGRVLNYDEEYLYLNECNPAFRDFATILFDTGMRPDELCSLQINAIDLDKRRINILKSKTKAGIRTVPMSDRVHLIISNRIRNAETNYLFGGGRGGKKNKRVIKFNGVHKGALERSKIDSINRSGTSGSATLYSCRHTFATRFIESGGNLLTLAKILGHSSLRMVMRYSHPSDEHSAAAINTMAALNKNAGTNLKVVPANNNFQNSENLNNKSNFQTKLSLVPKRYGLRTLTERKNVVNL